MTAPVPGAVIRYRGTRWTVVTCDDLSTGLRSERGESLDIATTELLDDPSFSSDADTPSFAELHLLDTTTEARRQQALFWFDEMYEVRYGIRPSQRALSTDPPPPTGTIEERLIALQNRLRLKGIEVSIGTLWRRWAQFNSGGLVGVTDKRGLPGYGRGPAYDRAVAELIDTVTARFTTKSTPSKKQIIELLRREAAETGVALPGRSRLYDLLTERTSATYTFGAATTRRSRRSSPQRTYDKAVATYPGQQLQLDTTPADLYAVTPDGSTQKIDLAFAIDVATRVIPAAILRPVASKSVDAIELVTRAMTPLPKQPGWHAYLAAARAYLPAELDSALADLDTEARARPGIDVQGLIVDRGSIFISDIFARALDARGIRYRWAGKGEPTAKPIVERTFLTIAEDFVRWVPGYKGRNVSQRGRHPERDAVWPLPLLQILLDLWVVTVYNNDLHSGLTVPLAPRMDLSPNQMLDALNTVHPSRAVELTRDEWIALQPSVDQSIQQYGINFRYLVYDSPRLTELRMRRAQSTNHAAGGKWNVRYDPNNLLQVWVRNDRPGREPHEEQWIECRWVLANQVTMPFGLDVLDAVRAGLDNPDRPTDRQILERAEQLHAVLLDGPLIPKPTPATGSDTSPSGEHNPTDATRTPRRNNAAPTRREQRAAVRNLIHNQLPPPVGRDNYPPSAAAIDRLAVASPSDIVADPCGPPLAAAATTDPDAPGPRLPALDPVPVIGLHENELDTSANELDLDASTDVDTEADIDTGIDVETEVDVDVDERSASEIPTHPRRLGTADYSEGW
ncbi:Mu transposase C-terminal domain-containing protein [Nocardia tengchongensis]|uniref:Mu transposase C-terminal domain-containing protein n=1 Tax=Nocardia tengchongensis TaxID=2055889 RepID=UPI0033CBC5F0